MKTLIFLLLTIMMCISCTKEPIETTNPGNVKITLDYAFPSKTGDMITKGEPTYLDFYNEYIASKILTPKTYYIKITPIDYPQINGWSGNGKWGSKTLIALSPAKYSVEGYSKPLKYEICGDTCCLKFHDTINVTQTTTNIILKAYYDCSLILLDTTDVKSTYLWTSGVAQNMIFKDHYNPTMMKTKEFYHYFYDDAAKIDSRLGDLFLNVYHRSTQPQTAIILYFYKWEAGKYYYFGETANGYTLTPMTSN
jgi:hypothetical protein